MAKVFKFLKNVLEVIIMKTKKDLSARLQLLINVDALDIHLGSQTIDDVLNHKVYRKFVLEECANTYNCDGYGKPLAKKEEA